MWSRCPAFASGGGISSDNSYNIISKGICWSTSINPTIDDLKVELGSGFGGIGSKIEGLMPGTVYYFRAYATNVVGIAYGRNLVARTFDGYITDYEGHVYSTVRLGNQEWMNRNLETSYFSNGDKIKTTGTPTLNTEQEGNSSMVLVTVLTGGVQLKHLPRMDTLYIAGRLTSKRLVLPKKIGNTDIR